MHAIDCHGTVAELQGTSCPNGLEPREQSGLFPRVAERQNRPQLTQALPRGDSTQEFLTFGQPNHEDVLTWTIVRCPM